MRTVEGAEVWRQQVHDRLDALKPIKTKLAQNGQTQTWLLRELNRQRGISLQRPSFYAYLNGHARIPQAVLSAACRIAGVRESDITRRIDLDVLLQSAKKPKANKVRKPRLRTNDRKRTTASA